jgi:hypothetical protein
MQTTVEETMKYTVSHGGARRGVLEGPPALRSIANGEDAGSEEGPRQTVDAQIDHDVVMEGSVWRFPARDAVREETWPRSPIPRSSSSRPRTTSR